MAVDTPARIAILGAGPIGLEAALYARFLGYDVDIYERGRICENMQRWGHVRLFTPAGMNRTPLTMAALSAQNPDLPHPADEALVTAREMLDTYFLPLANSDLLIDTLHLNTEVLAVGRDEYMKGDLIGNEDRGDDSFRILIRKADGQEEIREADVVIDTTGTYGNPNWAGQGGVPALGERRERPQLEYGLPDILGDARQVYADRHVLLVGSGYSAATNLLALVELAQQHPQTRITWVTRRAEAASETSPVHCIAQDTLPERDRIARAANQAALAGGAVTHWPGTTLHALVSQGDGSGFEVELRGEHAGKITVDRIVANVGYRPDNQIYQELQVHECYATGGPMRLAATLLEHPSIDCLAQPATGSEALLTTEPNFYLLGAKSYGRNSQFLLSRGQVQIRDLFKIIGDREELNLYQSISRLQ